MAATQTTQVYQDLKHKILHSGYAPSESLPEADLATTYSVSRNTIKKALLMLENDGLVVIEPNKGAKVRSYSKTEVLEYLEIREVLEERLMKLAVPAMTADDFEKLDRITA
ncbi:MAG: GntR family transcriptional regulator [Clostridia bacterium]|nr:GntR family transcriptional regulator [Clostridia bacterium]